MESLQKYFRGLRPDSIVPFLCIVFIGIFLFVTQFLASQNSPLNGPFILSILIFPSIMGGWFVYGAIQKVTSYKDIGPFFMSKIFYISILLFLGVYAYFI